MTLKPLEVLRKKLYELDEQIKTNPELEKQGERIYRRIKNLTVDDLETIYRAGV